MNINFGINIPRISFVEVQQLELQKSLARIEFEKIRPLVVTEIVRLQPSIIIDAGQDVFERTFKRQMESLKRIAKENGVG